MFLSTYEQTNHSGFDNCHACAHHHNRDADDNDIDDKDDSNCQITYYCELGYIAHLNLRTQLSYLPSLTIATIFF